jgi:hypothetical protein
MEIFIKANSKTIYIKEKVFLLHLKEYIQEISKRVFKMDTDSLNGKMDPFTGEIIMKDNVKEMDSFITVKMEV